MITLFSHWVRGATLLEVSCDFAFMVLGIIISVMWVGNNLPVSFGAVVAYAILLSITILALNSLMGLYERTHLSTLYQTRARAVLALHLSVPIAYCLLVILDMGEANRQFFQLSGMGAIFGMLANRLHSYHSPPLQLTVNKIMMVGSGVVAKNVAQIIAKSDRHVQIVGFYVSSNHEETAVTGSQIIGQGKSLLDTAREFKVDEIIVAVEERRGGGMPLRELLDCRLQGIRVLDLASHFERFLGQIRLDSLKASWLIFGSGFRQNFFRTFNKRLFDIACALFLLLLTLPIMLVTAVVIAIESGFPIFYGQERVGLNNRLIKVTKFRSMRTDAEKDGKPRWATAKDDRVTRVGRIIRKLRIDELPQLFSVILGDISLVGPRPERLFFVEQLTKDIPFYAARHSVKPGLTGWAQVRYHYGASVEDAAEKLQYDLYYVKNHSIFLDIVILFETIGVVVGGKGAQ